jgi:hypothetical protein
MSGGITDQSAAAAEARLRSRVRWFVGAHLVAISAIYGAVLAIGGGLASPPFPPDTGNKRHASTKDLAKPASEALNSNAALRAGSVTAVTLPLLDAKDPQAPWSVDERGQVRLRND